MFKSCTERPCPPSFGSELPEELFLLMDEEDQKMIICLLKDLLSTK